MKKAIITYENLSALSGCLSDAQRFTSHWFPKGEVSLLIAVLFCSCGKDDLPSTQSPDSPDFSASIGQIVSTRWQLVKLLYTAGDNEINAAWKEMEVEFTRDSSFFYLRDLVYDPDFHASVHDITLEHFISISHLLVNSHAMLSQSLLLIISTTSGKASSHTLFLSLKNLTETSSKLLLYKVSSSIFNIKLEKLIIYKLCILSKNVGYYIQKFLLKFLILYP